MQNAKRYAPINLLYLLDSRDVTAHELRQRLTNYCVVLWRKKYNQNHLVIDTEFYMTDLKIELPL